jgi:hypothetical protein
MGHALFESSAGDREPPEKTPDLPLKYNDENNKKKGKERIEKFSRQAKVEYSGNDRKREYDKKSVKNKKRARLFDENKKKIDEKRDNCNVKYVGEMDNVIDHSPIL